VDRDSGATRPMAGVSEAISLRPELAQLVASAVRDAADRAELAPHLWTSAVERLEAEPTPSQTLEAVTQLHQRVESHLR